MAMRGRGGRGNPTGPPRSITSRVYEQFKPMSEWRQEDDHDILLVYLPGFQKEYLKVTTEDLNIIRARGERRVVGNRWSRFQEDYRVPENCEMRSIRAKFDGGILTITMPRKIINAPSPPPPPPPPTTTTTTTQATPKTEESPIRRTNQEKPDKPETTRLEDNTLPPQAKPKSSTPPTKQPAPEAKQAVGFEHDAVEKPKVGEKTGLTPGKGKETIREEDSTLSPQSRPTSSSPPTKQPPSDLTPGKGKETISEEKTKRDLKGSNGKQPNYSGEVGGGLRDVVARRGMMSEDRKLLMNVGVGVLVIAALGVHVSYTIGLIGKGE